MRAQKSIMQRSLAGDEEFFQGRWQVKEQGFSEKEAEKKILRTQNLKHHHMCPEHKFPSLGSYWPAVEQQSKSLPRCMTASKLRNWYVRISTVCNLPPRDQAKARPNSLDSELLKKSREETVQPPFQKFAPYSHSQQHRVSCFSCVNPHSSFKRGLETF